MKKGLTRIGARGITRMMCGRPVMRMCKRALSADQPVLLLHF